MHRQGKAVSLLAELKRRKVLKVSAAYIVVAWIAVQVASIAFPAFEAPAWALRVFILVLALGFPLTVVLGWVLELTPDGVRVEAAPIGNKRVFGTAAALVALAIAWYTIGQPALRSGAEAAPAAASTAPATRAAPSAPLRSIAVLPFIDMSQGKDQEYFSDGITEEILNALTRIEGLKVAGRTSSFSFKGRNEDLKAIGAALGVAHVLEGSVRKQGDRIRITAQLIKVEDGFHLWSENYDRKLDDIFAVQDEISGAIATALSSKLSGGSGAADAIDPRVYDTYLRARQELASRDAKRIASAARLFAEVAEREPRFDPAWSGRAKALALVFNYAGGDAHAGIEEARQAAEHALELNPGNAEALMFRGFIDLLYHWRFEDGLRDVRSAIAIAPSDAEVANFAGDAFRLAGELDEALKWEQRAVELDPLFAVNHSDLGWVLLMRHRYPEALENGEHALRLDPNYWTAHDMRARVYLGMGKLDEALAEVGKMARINPGSANEIDLRGRIALARGDLAEARRQLEEGLRRARAGETLDYGNAQLQAGLGEHEAAARSLERAFALRDPYFVSETETIQIGQWPDHAGIRAVLMRPELAPMFARRAAYAAESRPGGSSAR